MSEELKPCPFCGKDDIVKSCVPLDYPTCNVKAYVTCNNCNAELSKNGNVKNSNKLLNDAIKMWNRRAEDETDQ